MHDAQSLLMQAGGHSAGMFEADPMAWVPRLNKTKVVHDAQRSRRHASLPDPKQTAVTARYSEAQRRALAQASRQLSATLSPLIATTLSEQLRRARSTPRWLNVLTAKPPSPAEIVAVAKSTANEASLAVQNLARDTQRTGEPPTLGTLVAEGFKKSAKFARWSPALIEVVAPGVGQAFDRADSPAMKIFIAAMAIIFPQIFRGGKGNGEFETLPMSGELELAA
jgi:hypothetical protein